MHCSILYTLQWFSCRNWESSQDRGGVVQAGDDQLFDQELHCFLYEERPDPAVAVEGTSAGLGVQDTLWFRINPRFLTVDEGDTVMSSTVTDRSIRGQSF